MNFSDSRKAFVFPLIVGLMAFAIALSSVLMSSIITKLNNIGRGSTCSLRAKYAATAAIDSLAHDGAFATIVNSPTCTGGTYILPTEGTCAIPGTDGTVVDIDSSCTYSAQVVSKATGTININAIGRCLSHECSGTNGAVVEINQDVKLGL